MTGTITKVFLIVALLVTGITGCATHRPSYAEQIAQIPQPTNDEDRQHKCAFLRGEIARQQNIAMVGAAQLQGMYALAIEASARNNIAALESRASDFDCSAAFSNQPVPMERSAPADVAKSKIESCIDACKANTSRTSDACFDACNH
ncbi:uncharacterized protein E1O_16010 [Burkholderiales bacterium GJ-E10]|nr:uncharacterized protein E1O_16010 [Burkholderiales bacterium GJ-E10]